MSFKQTKKLKQRYDHIELKRKLTEVKTKNKKRVETPVPRAHEVLWFFEYLADNYLTDFHNHITFNKKQVRETNFLSTHNLDKLIRLAENYNLLKVTQLKGLNELTVMLNPDVVQAGSYDGKNKQDEKLKDHYCSLKTNIKIKTEKKITRAVEMRIAKNLKNATPIKQIKDNVIELRKKC